MDKAVNASDVLAIARATSTFGFFLTFHLNKEEAHLYRIFNERISLPDQAAVTGKMSQEVPKERFMEVVNWLFTLTGPDDQENVTRILRQVLPAPLFAGVTQQIKASIGSGWAELTRRIPDLK
jgi:uncharacterized BrkB/YihY/UPF0761 family membrane protein